jgi:Uma2 family endonuclease
VPTIAVEFVSRTARDRRRDYIEKRQENREAGVKEYWIVDPFSRRMTVAFADGTERVVAESETYTTPLLPSFELPLATLLARADAWADEPAD